jgi:hypothetical protein
MASGSVRSGHHDANLQCPGFDAGGAKVGRGGFHRRHPFRRRTLFEAGFEGRQLFG